MSDVLDLLREKARSEAELLFRTYENYKGALPSFGFRISSAINRCTDAMIAELTNGNGTPEDASIRALLVPLVRDHMPASLLRAAGVPEGDDAKLAELLADRCPEAYVNAVMASSLAAHGGVGRSAHNS